MTAFHSFDETAALIEALDAVPRSELPNGAGRLALTRAIVAGEIDTLYRPLGAHAHNVCLAGLPADVDPRITVAEWVMCWRAQLQTPIPAFVLSVRRAHMALADALVTVASANATADQEAPADATADATADAEPSQERMR